MYFEKILNYVGAVMENKSLTEKEKESMIDDIKEAFLEIANISDTIIDVKCGAEKFNSQEEYIATINSAILSVDRLNKIYKNEFGIELVKKIPETSVEIYELSREFCKDLREISVDGN